MTTLETPELAAVDRSAGEIKSERRIVLFLIGGVLVTVTIIAKWFNIADPQVAEIPAAIGAVFLGGILDVRGFDFRGIGPRLPLQNSTDPNSPLRTNGARIGGNLVYFQNFELEFPLVEAVGVRGQRVDQRPHVVGVLLLAAMGQVGDEARRAAAVPAELLEHDRLAVVVEPRHHEALDLVFIHGFRLLYASSHFGEGLIHYIAQAVGGVFMRLELLVVPARLEGLNQVGRGHYFLVKAAHQLNCACVYACDVWNCVFRRILHCDGAFSCKNLCQLLF